MVEEIIYTNGTRTKTGEKLILKRFDKIHAKRLYMAWTNPQSFRYNDIPEVNMEDENEWDCVGEIANYGFPSDKGMYFMTIHRINPQTNEEELIGNCRFGKCPYKDYKDRNDVWDMGFSIIRDDDKLEYSDEEIIKAFTSESDQKTLGITALYADNTYWKNGYITEVIATILEIARQNGIKKVVSSADIHNLGSLKAHIKCGMKLSEINSEYKFDNDNNPEVDIDSEYKFDNDNDPEVDIDIDPNTPIQTPTKEEIDAYWDNIFLKAINKKINKVNNEHPNFWEDCRTQKLNKALTRNQDRRDFKATKQPQREM
jgi:RimJ/RimL family protein N-acetyltransferase